MMKDLRELFPDGSSDRNLSYESLVASIGVEVLLVESDNGWQGDSYLIVRDGDRYGYLTFGWGSCSGCDALQACYSYEDLEALRDDLARGIHWEDDCAGLLRYVRERDWSTDYGWSWRDTLKEFVPHATALLEKLVATNA
jgi:hypothetical protein